MRLHPVVAARVIFVLSVLGWTIVAALVDWALAPVLP